MKIYRIASGVVVPIERWKSVDWTKSNQEIAELLNVTKGTITENRKKYAPETMRKLDTTDWSKVDWSKSNQEITDILGKKNKDYVSMKRQIFSPETRQRDTDWSKVDWSKSNQEIADELKILKASVGKMRSEYAPETIYNPDAVWNNVDWTKSNFEISELLKISPSTVKQARRRYAPQTSSYNKNRPKIDWAKIDWAKRNVDIGIEEHVDPTLVSKMRGWFAPNTLKKENIRGQMVEWAAINWAKSNHQIKDEIIEQNKKENNGELTISTYNLLDKIYAYRRRYAPETIQKEDVLEQDTSKEPIAGKSFNWYKLAKSITLYRGESSYNKSGKYWTTDKEWARQFTQSGLDKEIKTITIPEEMIYVSQTLPMATKEDEISDSIKEAKSKGFKAILVNEGVNEPNSVLMV